MVMNGYGGGYWMRTPIAVRPYDNPLATFAASAVDSMAQSRQKEAYQQYLEQMLEEKIKGQEGVQAIKNQKPTGGAAANPDVLAYKQLQSAMTDYSNYIKDAQNNDQYKFMAPQQQQVYLKNASNAYFSDPARSAYTTIIMHAPEINQKLMSRNPTLKSLFDQNGKFVGTQDQGMPGQGSPAAATPPAPQAVPGMTAPPQQATPVVPKLPAQQPPGTPNGSPDMALPIDNPQAQYQVQ